MKNPNPENRSVKEPRNLKPEPAPTPPPARSICGPRASSVLRHSIVALLLCGALHAHAQSTAFTYQGFLTVNGAPANGTNDFEFRLFNAATLGAQQGSTVALDDIGVTNGLFTVTLDFGASVFDGSARWLDIAVRPGASMGAYTNLVPRQPVTSTPYAVRAGGAAAAGITGALPATALSGTYSGAVTFNNAANSFAGDGAGLTNLNATSLGGVAASNYWRIGGNAGVTTNRYIGTTDYQPLELRVNDSPAMRFQPSPQNWPSLVGGAANNYAHADNTGVAIGGGVGNGVDGTAGGSHIGGGRGNRMYTNAAGSVIGGGTGNQLGDGSVRSVIGGGWSNWIGGATGPDAANVARDITDGTSNTILVGETFPGNAFIGGGWANRIGRNSPNGVITGGRFNSIADGTSNTILFSETEPGGGFIGGGRGNVIQTNSPCDVIVGGGGNFVFGDGSVRFIGGGVSNVTDGCSHTFLGGGGLNRIGGSGDYTFLGGGWRNTNLTQYGVIVGGLNNRIGGETVGEDFFAGSGANLSGSPGNRWGDAIVGGSSNIIFGDGSVRFIANGINNVIDGTSNTILVGGGENRVQMPADYAFLGGGWRNTNAGAYSVIVGGDNNLTGSDHASVVGGLFNSAGGTRSSLVGGQNNDASGGHTFIGGGQDNVASASHATVAGGSGNNATATFATVGGGEFNTAGGTHSFLGGGAGNQATGAHSTVAGGQNNQATGIFATIPGGIGNQAGANAFAAGSNAKAVNTGAFVWADASGGDFSSTANNQFRVRATGGARFETGGAGLTVDGTSVFAGNNGAGLTNLNASALASGTVADARLSANVGLLSRNPQNFSGNNNFAGSVGIGTTSPSSQLHVRSASGDSAIHLESGSAGPWRWSLRSASSNSADQTARSFQIVRHQGALSAPMLLIDTNGCVGIGTSSPGDQLHVAAGIRAIGYRCKSGTFGGFNETNLFNFQWTGTQLQAWVDNVNVGTVQFISDRRLKEDIEPLSNDALARVLTLKPASFKFRDVGDGVFTGDDSMQEGFIADELQAVIPSAVEGDKDATTDNGRIQPQTVNPLPVLAVLTRAVQELNQKNEVRGERVEGKIQESEVRIQKLEAENAKLREELSAIRQLVEGIAMKGSQ